MYCNDCGEKIKDDAEYCPNCGAKIYRDGVKNVDLSEETTKSNMSSKKKREWLKKLTIIGSIVIIVLNIFFVARNISDRELLNNRKKEVEVVETVEKVESEQVDNQVTSDIADADNTTEILDVDEINIGDYITFGRYWGEAIEWRVLTKEINSSTGDKGILLVSRYVLECLPYNYEDEVPNLTWETCDLRRWLNYDFYDEAFNEDEKKQIMTVENDNPDSCFYDEMLEGKGGNATKDNVFLLSYVEVQNYFFDNNDRLCSPTNRVMAKYGTSDENNHYFWWLRSPGVGQGYALHVYYYGQLDYSPVDRDKMGVRPALWIHID